MGVTNSKSMLNSLVLVVQPGSASGSGRRLQSSACTAQQYAVTSRDMSGVNPDATGVLSTSCTVTGGLITATITRAVAGTYQLNPGGPTDMSWAIGGDVSLGMHVSAQVRHDVFVGIAVARMTLLKRIVRSCADAAAARPVRYSCRSLRSISQRV